MGGCVPKEGNDPRANNEPAMKTQEKKPAAPKIQSQQSNNSTSLKTSKVIFMGNANVGKTSMINAWIENNSQKGKNQPRTNVMEDFTKQMEVTDDAGAKHQLRLNIWDAAGEGGVHNLAHLFLKEAKVGILCYAIDNKNSFDQMNEWYDHLKDKEGEMFIVIVGSKSDLTDNRAVPKAFGQKLKKEIPNCKFNIETSAYTELDSIHQLFTQVGQEIINGKYYTEK